MLHLIGKDPLNDFQAGATYYIATGGLGPRPASYTHLCNVLSPEGMRIFGCIDEYCQWSITTGMTGGTLAGLIICDEILRRENPFSKVCTFL